MAFFQNYSAIRAQLKQQPIQPILCQRCGNKHVGEICAAMPTEFTWYGNAQEVFIVGSWSKWQCHQALKKQDDGSFQIIKNLLPDTYCYKFIVDNVWIYDENCAYTSDNLGGFNNIKLVSPMNALKQSAKTDTGDAYVTIQSSVKANELKIIGSWDNWKSQQAMKRNYNHLKNHQQFIIQKILEPMKYQFKLIADGKYITDPMHPSIQNPFGSYNNWIVVSPDRIGNEHQFMKHRKSINYGAFNPTCFVWTKQHLQYFPYYNIYGHKTCIVGDYLYIVGGLNRGTYKNAIIKVNLDTFECQQFFGFDDNQFPARAFHQVKAYGNKLLIFGGIGNNMILEDYLSFNTNNDSISIQPKIRGNPPEKRQKNSCVIFNDILIFFGGYIWTEDLEVQVMYDNVSILDISEMKWVNVQKLDGPKPKARYAHTSTLYNEYMYIFGGVINAAQLQPTNDVWRLKLIANQKMQWEQVKVSGAYPAPRYGHTANIINEYIMIFGGMTSKQIMLNDLYILNAKQNKWIKPDIKGQIPKPRYFHHASVMDQQGIIVLGGKTGKGNKSQHAYVLKSQLQGNSLDF